MSFGRLASRTLIGGLFFGHGAQKLLGWFDGDGPEGTAGFFENVLGLRPGKRHVALAGGTEMAAGGLFVLGALTPLATMGTVATMTTAIRKVHGANGPWNQQSGWEYPAILAGASVILAETGPGSFSVDEARFPGFKGTGWALLATAAGVAGSYVATELLSEPASAEDGQGAGSANGSGASVPAGSTA